MLSDDEHSSSDSWAGVLADGARDFSLQYRFVHALRTAAALTRATRAVTVATGRHALVRAVFRLREYARDRAALRTLSLLARGAAHAALCTRGLRALYMHARTRIKLRTAVAASLRTRALSCVRAWSERTRSSQTARVVSDCVTNCAFVRAKRRALMSWRAAAAFTRIERCFRDLTLTGRLRAALSSWRASIVSIRSTRVLSSILAAQTTRRRLMEAISLWREVTAREKLSLTFAAQVNAIRGARSARLLLLFCRAALFLRARALRRQLRVWREASRVRRAAAHLAVRALERAMTAVALRTWKLRAAVLCAQETSWLLTCVARLASLKRRCATAVKSWRSTCREALRMRGAVARVQEVRRHHALARYTIFWRNRVGAAHRRCRLQALAERFSAARLFFHAWPRLAAASIMCRISATRLSAIGAQARPLLLFARSRLARWRAHARGKRAAGERLLISMGAIADGGAAPRAGLAWFASRVATLRDGGARTPASDFQIENSAPDPYENLAADIERAENSAIFLAAGVEPPACVRASQRAPAAAVKRPEPIALSEQSTHSELSRGGAAVQMSRRDVLIGVLLAEWAREAEEDEWGGGM